MSEPSSTSESQREWHVLLSGENLGPFRRDFLRAMLDDHPEGWNAAVWRLGMIDWREARTVSALTREGKGSEPPLISAGAGLEDPARALAAAARDTSGQLRVLAYGERLESQPAPRIEVTPLPPAPPPAVTGEWSSVFTSELSAIDANELRAQAERAPNVTGEWSSVVTSELSAIDPDELRKLAQHLPESALTRTELPAFNPGLAREPALPSVILSAETSTELPSFSWKRESDAKVPARAPATALASPTSPEPATATPTPRSLRAYRPASGATQRPSTESPAPSRVPLYVLGVLLLLSAAAFAAALTMRWLHAAEVTSSPARTYAHAPELPRLVLPPSAAAAPEALAAARLPTAALPSASDAHPVVITASAEQPHKQAIARPARRIDAAQSRVTRVRVSAAWAKVHVGNQPEAKVVCVLPRGTELAVLTELPSAEGRWFAVHCDANVVGWVAQRDLTLEP